ncbi:hypothetical protein O6H91_Y326900 [Diphasiastrum complanatum]|nr:hypothetical protein O6H91_Y326900 [Diphasiastrum complanatum]
MAIQDISPKCSFREESFWNEFFEARKGESFEAHAAWCHLSSLFARHCLLFSSQQATSHMLVPACGNSELSANIYDAGFKNITNIDFSRKVVAEMLRKHVRKRPFMRWLVMDMTRMQFSDGSFDIVLDKGGLDVLIAGSEDDDTSKDSYFFEVKRILKPAGRYACVIFAEKHALEVLASNFTLGWRITLCGVPKVSGVVLVVATKEISPAVHNISSESDKSIHENEKTQMEALQTLFSKRLKAQAKDTRERLGIFKQSVAENKSFKRMFFESLHPGQRIIMSLGDFNQSSPKFRTVVMDANNCETLHYTCAVFLVPEGRASEWLFSSEKGQWQVVETAKAGRLIMVFLGAYDLSGGMRNLQEILSPLIKILLPVGYNNGNVPFLISDDGISKRTLLEETHSPVTGNMLVEDVALPWEKKFGSKLVVSKYKKFRRLIFKRNPNLIQSEALLVLEKCTEENNVSTANLSHHPGTCGKLKVDHSYLASPYHQGMVAGLALISSRLENWVLSKELINVMVVGLGAAVLPMFMYRHLPVHRIQVVELDPVVGELAKRHFGFFEDDRMQVIYRDGVAAVKQLARLKCDNAAKRREEQFDVSRSKCTGNSVHTSPTLEDNSDELHILFIDTDSADPR